jgi:hypothetical protein
LFVEVANWGQQNEPNNGVAKHIERETNNKLKVVGIVPTGFQEVADYFF